MTNDEILFNLSDETKQYFDDAFSFLDFFILNNVELSDIPDEDNMGIAFLLSSIKNDKILSKFFTEHGLTYERICDYFNSIGFDLSKATANKSEKSFYVENNTLMPLFAEIASRLKYNNYLENTDILLSDLKPYQIFDFMLENYYESIVILCDALGINIDEDFLSDIARIIYDQDSQFAESLGVDIEAEEQKELASNYKEYNFHKCRIVVDVDDALICFNDNMDFNEAIVSGKYDNNENNDHRMDTEGTISHLEKNKMYRIKRFCGHSDVSKETLDKIFASSRVLDQITMKLVDLENDNISFNISFDSKRTFNTIPTIEEENKETTNNIMRMSGFSPERKTKSESPTPYLDKYGFDLTKDRYLKDPSVGREDKIRELEKILLYPEQDKSIIITGIAGCGKTALVKGLAYRIQKGDVPEALKDLRIISIDCATLVAGTKYVGTLEEKMKNILEDASSSKNIVLFMDEIHQALGAGKSEGDDNSVSEILKPYLDYGRARVIGSTTTAEYDEYVSKDGAFKTRFKKVTLKEPDEDIIYQILNDLIESYNKFSYSKLLIPNDERDMVIKWLLSATQERHRDYFDKASNPRLVLDIIKDAYALAALDNRTEVSYEDLKAAVSQEERLSKSSREDSVKRLSYLKPYKPKDNIIVFRLVQK